MNNDFWGAIIVIQLLVLTGITGHYLESTRNQIKSLREELKDKTK